MVRLKVKQSVAIGAGAAVSQSHFGSIKSLMKKKNKKKIRDLDPIIFRLKIKTNSYNLLRFENFYNLFLYICTSGFLIYFMRNYLFSVFYNSPFNILYSHS